MPAQIYAYTHTCRHTQSLRGQIADNFALRGSDTKYSIYIKAELDLCLDLNFTNGVKREIGFLQKNLDLDAIIGLDLKFECGHALKVLYSIDLSSH